MLIKNIYCADKDLKSSDTISALANISKGVRPSRAIPCMVYYS